MGAGGEVGGEEGGGGGRGGCGEVGGSGGCLCRRCQLQMVGVVFIPLSLSPCPWLCGHLVITRWLAVSTLCVPRCSPSSATRTTRRGSPSSILMECFGDTLQQIGEW